MVFTASFQSWRIGVLGSPPVWIFSEVTWPHLHIFRVKFNPCSCPTRYFITNIRVKSKWLEVIGLYFTCVQLVNRNSGLTRSIHHVLTKFTCNVGKFVKIISCRFCPVFPNFSDFLKGHSHLCRWAMHSMVESQVPTKRRPLPSKESQPSISTMQSVPSWRIPGPQTESEFQLTGSRSYPVFSTVSTGF
jgi:hypothetical protein